MDPRAERTRTALLRATEGLVREQALESVTLEEIAERAGVAVGSIYNHFGSKAGLHAAVLERAPDVDRAFMDRAYLVDGTPLQRIYAAADEYAAFALTHPDFFRMLAFPGPLGQYEASKQLAERLARSVDAQNQRLVETLREAMAEGQLRAIDPEDAATILWASWNGILSLGWRPDALRRDEGELRRLLAVATDMVATGLLPAHPA